MIFVKLSGGLGNQMFQYACGRSLAARRGLKLVLDCSMFEIGQDHLSATKRIFELDVFEIKAEILKPFKVNYLFLKFSIVSLKRVADLIRLNRLYRSIYISEDPANTIDLYSGASCNCILNGYWQSEEYFKESVNLIRNDFQFIKSLNGKNNELALKIRNSNSVSIHIRRGDYITSAESNKTHGICSLEYYAKAIGLIHTKVKNPVFYIFSDDLDWVKLNLHLTSEYEYIGGNDKNCGYVDMQLMSLCKHNIIANSSFSWWAAWLNDNDKKIIIAPEKWFSDPHLQFKSRQLIPADWTIL
jgi:hypothetical protein